MEQSALKKYAMLSVGGKQREFAVGAKVPSSMRVSDGDGE
jgi:hypothetical protein